MKIRISSTPLQASSSLSPFLLPSSLPPPSYSVLLFPFLFLVSPLTHSLASLPVSFSVAPAEAAHEWHCDMKDFAGSLFADLRSDSLPVSPTPQTALFFPTPQAGSALLMLPQAWEELPVSLGGHGLSCWSCSNAIAVGGLKHRATLFSSAGEGGAGVRTLSQLLFTPRIIPVPIPICLDVRISPS